MMAMVATTRFIDYLPAVFRQDEGEDGSFLQHFLQAFEAVFASIQQELDAIPYLFTLIPTPVLEHTVQAGARMLPLDSAAGLCPGDILSLLDVDQRRVEFVEVQAVPPDLIPTSLLLRYPLRFDHTRGTSVSVVGLPGPATTLSLPVSSGQSVLTVTRASSLGAASGDVLRLDEGERSEYARVLTVTAASIAVTPTLQHSHEAGKPVVLMQPTPRTTPPLTFASAVRAGPELVLRTPVLAGERFIELDTLTGLGVGDIMHLHELDPARIEFVRIAALPPEPVGAGLLRRAIRLSQPVRCRHEAGVGVSILGAPAGATSLSAPAEVGATTLTVADPEILGAASADVLQVDEAGAAEYVQVRVSAGQTVTVTPPLQQAHGPGQPVVRRVPSGSGTAFLSWLAGWIGLALRPDRGEQWNRQLVRLAGRIWPWRGTQVGCEAFLNSWLRGEARATIFDPANPLQIGLVSTIGVDTIICGSVPHFFWVDLVTDERNSRLYHPDGLHELIQAAQQVLRQEKPTHTYADLRLQAHTMQIGVDPETTFGAEIGARVGVTTLLWEAPLLIPGDR
jgi:hypothetical protein